MPPPMSRPKYRSKRGIEQMLDAVAADRDLWQLLGGAAADLDERVAAVRLTIQNAGRVAREELGLPGN